MAKYHKNLKYHNDTTEKHKVTRDELNFLLDLQKELNTQDDLGQAEPRFWVIKGSERFYHVEDADGFELYDSDGCSILAKDTKEICEYICENLLDEINADRLIGEEFTVAYKKGIWGRDCILVKWISGGCDEYEEIIELSDLNEIKDWLNAQGFNYIVVSYKILEKIYENTMFLTQADAESHLKANYYHYSEDAHTYAMTAWRDARMEKLIKILQEVDFKSINTGE